MIRVCQLITELRPAGAEGCVLELARRLPRDRFAVEVAAFKGGPVAELLRQADVPVHVLEVRGKWDLLRASRLTNILRQGHFDLLHTHLFHADFVGRAAARKAGLRHVVHTVHVAEQRWRPWQFLWARLAARSADRIICVSEGVRQFHSGRTGLGDESYQVIYNGIDADRYARDEARRLERRRQWDIAPQDVLCAFVGRLDRQKGIDVLLEAFERAAANPPAPSPPLRLIVAGDGPLRSAVQSWLERSPAGRRARYLGHTGDVPGLLSAADIFCQPSRWEGFCLAAAEAMAAQLPVIGTDVAGLNEVIADGQTGLICPAGDSNALAAAIARLRDDSLLRTQLGAAGRRRVVEKFSLERFVTQHAELYEQIVSSRE
jgi:glycosyltransferase involved in cell wall biosynthesis